MLVMEILLFGPRIVYWLVLAPIWWVAGYLASYFYPLEGETGNFLLSWVFSLMIGTLLVFACITFLS